MLLCFLHLFSLPLTCNPVSQYRDWDKVDVDAIVADMDRQEDLEKEDAARARLAKERAAREAEELAAAARIEQAIALKEEGNAWLKQGDLKGALQKVGFCFFSIVWGCPLLPLIP